MSKRLKHTMSGYTLVEILIVLFIVSIVATTAMLSISHNDNKQMETFANELTQMLALAEEQAMLEPRVLGFNIGERSVQFTSLQHNSKDNKSSWILLDDHALGRHKIPSNVHLGIEAGNQKIASDNKLNPQIIISTNGDITPFTIYIGKKGQKPRYAIIGDAGGNVISKSLT